MDHEKLISIN